MIVGKVHRMIAIDHREPETKQVVLTDRIGHGKKCAQKHGQITLKKCGSLLIQPHGRLHVSNK